MPGRVGYAAQDEAERLLLCGDETALPGSRRASMLAARRGADRRLAGDRAGHG
jgi:NADPH-dependent ferric siderophore reductase